MVQLAELSSEKEQLEYLVERLQQETEKVGFYVIMYQHQRMKKKMKIQEKEDEVRQLAKDRTELQDKLTKLQGSVKNLVSGNSKDPDYEIIIEKKLTEESVDIEEKKKILELVSEIDTESNQIIARCEISELGFGRIPRLKL